MQALVYERSVSRWAIANLATRFGRSVAKGGPVQLREVKEPTPPNDNWVRVTPLLSGICGSDLSTVNGTSSGYFEQVMSFPFTLGHEMVGELADGTRVVIEPALGCVVRGITPQCASCANGNHGLCENVVEGDIAAGLQTGYCQSTGGGWSDSLIAHKSQLHTVPDDLSNEAAVMVEPTACAVHSVRTRADLDNADVAIIGAGTLGLLTIAALKRFATPKRVVVAAKHPHQRAFAKDFGADMVVKPSELTRSVRSSTRSLMLKKTLLSRERITRGVDVVFDCVGSSESIAQALAIVKSRGRIVLVGMPANVTVDLAPLWQREVELVGDYAYSHHHDGSDFEKAMELVRDADLGRLVSATYGLAQYRDAIDHAAHAGARGAVRIAFDLKNGNRRKNA